MAPCDQFVDLGVGLSFILAREPGVDDGLRQLRSNGPRADGNDLGVVRLAGALGAVAVRGLGCADAWHLVRGDRHADPGSAEQYAALVVSGDNAVSNLHSDVGVVHRFAARGRSKGVDCVAEGFEVGDDDRAELDRSLIIA
jgi:hypothetical protein